MNWTSAVSSVSGRSSALSTQSPVMAWSKCFQSAGGAKELGENPKICGVLNRKILSQPLNVASLQPAAAQFR